MGKWGRGIDFWWGGKKKLVGGIFPGGGEGMSEFLAGGGTPTPTSPVWKTLNMHIKMYDPLNS